MKIDGKPLLLVLAVAGIVSAASAQPGRTLYRIDVTAPGTKSQGLRGTLYDDQGRPIEAGPDVQTAIGQFRWIPCRQLWASCGRWRAETPPAVSSHLRQEVSVRAYRIVYEERGDGVHWTGELVGAPATAQDTGRIETPMGVFRWASGRAGRMHWRGWLPDNWPHLPFPNAPGHNRR